MTLTEEKIKEYLNKANQIIKDNEPLITEEKTEIINMNFIKCEPHRELINKLRVQYKDKLRKFKELHSNKKLEEKERKKAKLYIRYINTYYPYKFNYGGFLTKFDDNTLTLINKHKLPWTISINDNFIFYVNATLPLTANEKQREFFVNLIRHQGDN